jgi:hypothetical protein
MQLTTDQLQFLARLSKSPDGRFLVSNYLEPKLAEADGKLRTARGEDIFRAQGAATVLAELIADIAAADKRLTQATLTRTRVAA